MLVDEVHNLGSPSIIQKSTEVDDDRYQNALELFGYRLGLSATPMHDFDDQRNKFLLSQFSDLIPIMNQRMIGVIWISISEEREGFLRLGIQT